MQVCGVLYENEAVRDRYSLVTYSHASAATKAGAHVTHLHPCSACSTLKDLSVYMGVHNLTAPVRSCGLDVLSKDKEMKCLRALGFTEDCVNIWYYNTLNSRKDCAIPCLVNNHYPYNNPDGSLNPCIQCDEDKSGPIFKQFRCVSNTVWFGQISAVVLIRVIESETAQANITLPTR